MDLILTQLNIFSISITMLYNYAKFKSRHYLQNHKLALIKHLYFLDNYKNNYINNSKNILIGFNIIFSSGPLNV